MRFERIRLNECFEQLSSNGADPVLDMYFPYNMTEMHREQQKRPCMLICPGGGYGMCSQREAEPIALHFLPEGYNVFVLYYSVAPHRFPTQITEVAAAVELIYKNSEEWNCDINKIAIMGFSAGGHLAAHYSTAFDCAEVRKVFPESKSVNASVLCYPVITADPEKAHMGSFQNLLGHYPETEEELKVFSCDRLVKSTTPPAFLWHTSDDSAVPVINTLLYAEALTKYKIPVEVHIYPHGNHGLATSDNQTLDNTDQNTAHVSAWLPAVKKWLKLIF
ncbi:MAG: alpha/beta hydrolase [Oscillospiraceae bacterium]|nr:alpha/beta hydrolase [Oscillospiraceae bacterium]